MLTSSIISVPRRFLCKTNHLTSFEIVSRRQMFTRKPWSVDEFTASFPCILFLAFCNKPRIEMFSIVSRPLNADISPLLKYHKFRLTVNSILATYPEELPLNLFIIFKKIFPL